MGTGIGESSVTSSEPGIVPRAIEEIFRLLSVKYPDEGAGEGSCSMFASFIEIYNEQVRDLLCTSAGTKANQNLVIREDSTGDIYLAGCTEESIKSPSDLYK